MPFEQNTEFPVQAQSLAHSSMFRLQTTRSTDSQLALESKLFKDDEGTMVLTPL